MINLRKVQSQLNEIGSFCCSKMQLREMLRWWLLPFSIMWYLFITFTLQTEKYTRIEIYEGSYSIFFNLLIIINNNLYFMDTFFDTWLCWVSVFAEKYFSYVFMCFQIADWCPKDSSENWSTLMAARKLAALFAAVLQLCLCEWVSFSLHICALKFS